MSPTHLNSSVSQLLFILTNKFYALDYLEPDQLSYYKCLRWTGEHLKSQNHDGIIARDGHNFLICFQNCTAESAYASPQLALSFRKPTKPIASDCGYVIVRPLKGN